MNFRTNERYIRVDLTGIVKILKAHNNSCSMKYKVYLNGQPATIFVEADLNRQHCKLNGFMLELTTTACNYGGVRYWFACPVCGGRCRVVYWQSPYNYWACRKCLNLVYHSQQVTKTDFLTWYDKAVKVARIIEPGYDAEPIDFLFCSNLLWLFPDKPKYMKFTKYERLRNQFCRYAEIEQQLDQKELARLKI